jgi:hypothetical protein
LEQRLGLEFPQLLAARERTRLGLARRRRAVTNLATDDKTAVVFVGSWGRHEVTSASDNDFYVLSAGEPRQGVAPTVTQVTETLRALEGDFQPPSEDGPFGDGNVFLEALVRNIGRNEDDNDNLTRRMLLVLESLAIRGEAVHESARSDVIDRYLEHPVKPYHPPRLFLNDVVRYWRTVCVDFAGKMRMRHGTGWGLRNAKLRTTRKLLFASGLVPLLRCHELSTEEIRPFLLAQFDMPPVDRVAAALLHYDQMTAASRLFGAYDRFFEVLNTSVRAELNAIRSRPEADESDRFQAVARIGDDVQGGLLDLLFSPPLARTTRDFGIF